MCIHPSPSNPPSLHETRWEDLWQQQMNQNRVCKNHLECASIWITVEKAREFWNSACMNPGKYAHIIEMIRTLHPRKILDIGGGPGTLALPLAERGSQVTVVEPAVGMITVLNENATGSGIPGIHPINQRWEEVEIQDLHGPYDVVIACFSLGMPDISDAVRKMEQVCSGTIMLVWFAGITPWEIVLQDLWQKYHQTPYSRGPKSDILFQVLYQMGIYPDVRVNREKDLIEHGQINDIVNDYAQRLCISEGADRTPIEEYFKALISERDGTCRLPGELTTMILSWKSRSMP